MVDILAKKLWYCIRNFLHTSLKPSLEGARDPCLSSCKAARE